MRPLVTECILILLIYLILGLGITIVPTLASSNTQTLIEEDRNRLDLREKDGRQEIKIRSRHTQKSHHENSHNRRIRSGNNTRINDHSGHGKKHSGQGKGNHGHRSRSNHRGPGSGKSLR